MYTLYNIFLFDIEVVLLKIHPNRIKKNKMKKKIGGTKERKSGQNLILEDACMMMINTRTMLFIEC